MGKKKIDKKETWQNFKQTFKYVKKHKVRFIIYAITAVLISVIGVIVPYLSAQELLAITGADFNSLEHLAILIFLLGGFKQGVNYLNFRVADKVYITISKDIQIDLARETLKIKTQEIEKNTTGLFIDRLTGDANSIANIYGNLADALINILTNGGIIITIFILNKFIFGFYLITSLIKLLLNQYRIKVFYQNDKKIREGREKNVGLFSELVRGEKDIKVLNAESSFLNNINSSFENLTKQIEERNKTNRFLHSALGFISETANLLLILLAILLIKNNYLTIATFIVLYNYRNGVSSLFNYLSYFGEFINDFSLSSKRVFEVLNSNKFAKESFGNKHLKHIKGDFEFQNVGFSYDNKREVLKNVSFKVPANHTVSFVGKSGAGKSTIFALLAKLYDNYTGKILIDGNDIKDLDKDSLRGNISIINQNPYIFNMSIKDNFRVIKENITDKEIIETCKNASLHDYIMSLPEKYDTVVGEGGVNLSGGQKQRLAIARAFAQKTEIILFDEATSALDNETQGKITEAINNLKKDYTILIIAHRLSTVINSDKIIFIDEGKIIDEGTHEELLKNNKEYKKLYELELKKAR